MRAHRRQGAVALAALALLAGCGDEETVEGPAPKAPERMTLRIGDLKNGDRIPKAATCDGRDVAPALSWSGVPRRAREVAVVMEDPDAPGGTFVHWTVYGLPPADAEQFVEPASSGGEQGENSFGDTGYGGPCPPEGDPPHHYEFVVYALAEPLGLGAGASPGDVRDAIAERAIARGRLTLTYGR